MLRTVCAADGYYARVKALLTFYDAVPLADDKALMTGQGSAVLLPDILKTIELNNLAK